MGTPGHREEGKAEGRWGGPGTRQGRLLLKGPQARQHTATRRWVLKAPTVHNHGRTWQDTSPLASSQLLQGPHYTPSQKWAQRKPGQEHKGVTGHRPGPGGTGSKGTQQALDSARSYRAGCPPTPASGLPLIWTRRPPPGEQAEPTWAPSQSLLPLPED